MPGRDPELTHSDTVYSETVYRPKDQTARGEKRRKMLLIALVALLLLILLVIIIVVASKKAQQNQQALLVYPERKENTIRYVTNDTNTSASYIDSIRALLQEYDEMEQEHKDKLLNCTDAASSSTDSDRVCRFDTAEIELSLSADFGYSEGKPVIILQLKPSEDWTPTLGTNRTHVPVVCKGREMEDDENMGEVSIIPQQGFPAKFFPYKGQSSYMAPLVLVKFNSPKIGVIIAVVCTVDDPSLTTDNKSLFQSQFWLQVDSQ